MKVGRLIEADHGYTGSLRTLDVSAKLRFDRNERGRADNAPDYIVSAVTGDGELVEIGAAWAKESNANGRAVRFLTMTLDAPSWDRPLNLAAFPSDDDRDGSLDIQWRRERQDRRAA